MIFTTPNGLLKQLAKTVLETQRPARLDAIVRAHTDSSGAIPASASAAPTSGLAGLLHTWRSGHEDGDEEAANEQ